MNQIFYTEKIAHGFRLAFMNLSYFRMSVSAKSINHSAIDPSCRALVCTGGFGIYAVARVSWRLDSLISRHRRVTQNS